MALASEQSSRAAPVPPPGASSLNDWAAPIISIFIISGFVGLSALVMFRAVPDSSLQVATGLVEVFKILTVTIVSYYCGSSANSARKTELLAKSVPAQLLPNPGAIVPAQSACEACGTSACTSKDASEQAASAARPGPSARPDDEER